MARREGGEESWVGALEEGVETLPLHTVHLLSVLACHILEVLLPLLHSVGMDVGVILCRICEPLNVSVLCLHLGQQALGRLCWRRRTGSWCSCWQGSSVGSCALCAADPAHVGSILHWRILAWLRVEHHHVGSAAALGVLRHLDHHLARQELRHALLHAHRRRRRRSCTGREWEEREGRREVQPLEEPRLVTHNAP